MQCWLCVCIIWLSACKLKSIACGRDWSKSDWHENSRNENKHKVLLTLWRWNIQLARLRMSCRNEIKWRWFVERKGKNCATRARVVVALGRQQGKATKLPVAIFVTFIRIGARQSLAGSREHGCPMASNPIRLMDSDRDKLTPSFHWWAGLARNSGMPSGGQLYHQASGLWHCSLCFN